MWRSSGLPSPAMFEADPARDLAALRVPLTGSLQAADDRWLPYRLLDPAGAPVEAVSNYFRDVQAAGRSAATIRSYGTDLLRWFRFLWAIDVAWDRASRVEARNFCRWLFRSWTARRSAASSPRIRALLCATPTARSGTSAWGWNL